MSCLNDFLIRLQRMKYNLELIQTNEHVIADMVRRAQEQNNIIKGPGSSVTQQNISFNDYNNLDMKAASQGGKKMRSKSKKSHHKSNRNKKRNKKKNTKKRRQNRKTKKKSRKH